MMNSIYSTLILLFSTIYISLAQTEFNPEYPKKENEIIAKNLTFPVESRQKGEGGTILLSIKIDQNGMLDSTIVLEESHPPLMNEVMKSVGILKEFWKPEYLEGREYNRKYLLSFHFTSGTSRSQPVDQKAQLYKAIQKGKNKNA